MFHVLAQLEAHAWCRNGDHPQDACRIITPEPVEPGAPAVPFLSEGEIVRYYRHPDDDGGRECGDCGHRMHDHGWIDQGARGRVVCPGDWIITVPLATQGLVAYFPVSPEMAAGLFEVTG